MRKADRFAAFIDYFHTNNVIAETELVYTSPFQLLVAVILSAQCTDKRVNQITPALFSNFPNPESLSKATFEDVFPLIRSCSYPNNKSKHLIGMAQMLVRDFEGRVPTEIQDLQKLPGVGRKTANVVANVAFKQATMPVDTHVFRVAKRIGLASQNSKTPYDVEKQLVRHIPAKYLGDAHHWLILHGRYICLARKPKCSECGLKPFCRYFEKSTPMDSGIQKSA